MDLLTILLLLGIAKDLFSTPKKAANNNSSISTEDDRENKKLFTIFIMFMATVVCMLTPNSLLFSPNYKDITLSILLLGNFFLAFKIALT